MSNATSPVKKKKTNTMQTVDRSLALMELLSNTKDGLSAAELSRLLNITRTSTYSILNSLMNYGFVEELPLTRRYIIGYHFFALGSAYRYHYPFLNVVEKYLEHLDSRFEVNVSILKPGMQLLILMARNSVYMPNASPVRIKPAYATASGKLLLSYIDSESFIDAFGDVKFKRFTSKTISNIETLTKELKDIRENGYAIELEEIALGRGCIAFPIYDASQKVIASISVSGKKDMMQTEHDNLCDSLRDVSLAVSTELGYGIV